MIQITQIKVFSSTDFGEIQSEVNSFLKNKDHNKILSVTSNINEDKYIVTVLYIKILQ